MVFPPLTVSLSESLHSLPSFWEWSALVDIPSITITQVLPQVWSGALSIILIKFWGHSALVDILPSLYKSAVLSSWSPQSSQFPQSLSLSTHSHSYSASLYQLPTLPTLHSNHFKPQDIPYFPTPFLTAAQPVTPPPSALIVLPSSHIGWTAGSTLWYVHGIPKWWGWTYLHVDSWSLTCWDRVGFKWYPSIHRWGYQLRGSHRGFGRCRGPGK